jgi:hypothetical protein
MTEIISPILFTKRPTFHKNAPTFFQNKSKTSESRLLEVLYVKSKKKTQVIKCRIVRVSNCLGDEMSHTGAELSGFRTVLVPKCLIQVPNWPGAEVSSIQVVSLSRKMLKKNVNLKKGKNFFSIFLSFCLLLFFWSTKFVSVGTTCKYVIN